MPDMQTRIRQSLAELSPQLKLAARYLLAHESAAAMTSMRTMAERAGVLPATMVRLARKLGYSDWNALRESLRERLLDKTEGPITARARHLTERPADCRAQGIVADLLALEEGNLRATWEGMDPAVLEQAVAALSSARRVLFLGLRSCHPVAFGLHYAFGMLRDNGHLVMNGGGSMVDSFISLTPADLVIGIGFEPYSRETLELLEMAAATGARTLVITDAAASPLAACATYPIVVANESPSLFQSILAAQSVAQALIALLIAAEGQPAIEALNHREARLQALGAYWKNPK